MTDDIAKLSEENRSLKQALDSHNTRIVSLLKQIEITLDDLRAIREDGQLNRTTELAIQSVIEGLLKASHP